MRQDCARTLLAGFCAIVLAATAFAATSDEDALERERKEVAKGLEHFAAGEYWKALRAFEFATRRDDIYAFAEEPKNRIAFYHIGLIHRDGLVFNASLDDAYYAFRRAAELGYPPAQFALGAMYDAGTGMPRNAGKAIPWYMAAANGGNADAVKALARMHELGEWTPPDAERPFAWIDDLDGQVVLADLYRTGDGLPRDAQRAVELYVAAANQGHTGAQRTLGHMLLRGDGLERNLLEGVWWLRNAAEARDVDAMYTLGMLYYSGPERFRNVFKSKHWLRKAGFAGNADAFFQLGTMYENGEAGLGDTPDMETAKEYYGYASERGHQGAKRRLKELEP